MSAAMETGALRRVDALESMVREMRAQTLKAVSAFIAAQDFGEDHPLNQLSAILTAVSGEPA